MGKKLRDGNVLCPEVGIQPQHVVLREGGEVPDHELNRVVRSVEKEGIDVQNSISSSGALLTNQQIIK